MRKVRDSAPKIRKPPSKATSIILFMVQPSYFLPCIDLIGNSKYQGKGVFHEVFLVLKKWIRKDTKIKVIRAGVDIDNINSISAFLKCGFKPISKNTKKITYEILL